MRRKCGCADGGGYAGRRCKRYSSARRSHRMAIFPHVVARLAAYADEICTPSLTLRLDGTLAPHRATLLLAHHRCRIYPACPCRAALFTHTDRFLPPLPASMGCAGKPACRAPSRNAACCGACACAREGVRWALPLAARQRVLLPSCPCLCATKQLLQWSAQQPAVCTRSLPRVRNRCTVVATVAACADAHVQRGPIRRTPAPRCTVWRVAAARVRHARDLRRSPVAVEDAVHHRPCARVIFLTLYAASLAVFVRCGTFARAALAWGMRKASRAFLRVSARCSRSRYCGYATTLESRPAGTTSARLLACRFLPRHLRSCKGRLAGALGRLDGMYARLGRSLLVLLCELDVLLEMWG
eukprot:IDg2615t1